MTYSKSHTTQLIAGAAFALLFAFIYFMKIIPHETGGIITPYPERSSAAENPSAVKGVSVSPGHSLSPFISNQWYTSVQTKFPSQPLYAFPLSFRVSADGLGFSSPDMKKTADTIFASYTEDFTVGPPSSLQKPKITHVGDWSINITQSSSKGETLSYFLAHGIPYTTLKSTSKSLNFTVPGEFTVKTLDAGSFILTTRGHSYLVSSTQHFTVTKKPKLVNVAPASTILVALLDNPDHAQNFKQLTGIDITDTRADYELNGAAMNTTYHIETNNILPLIALLPHQYNHITGDLTEIGGYESLRGPLKLVRAQSFGTTLSFDEPPSGFTKTTTGVSEITAQIKKDTLTLLAGKVPDSKDYYLGTWMGKVDTLILLADSYGLTKEKQQLLAFLKPVFVKSLGYFSYDSAKTSLIAQKPEFGNEKLNDHHFHYGYYIRTAAVIASYDATFAAQVKDKVTAMVDDIMTMDRNSTKYPYLRHFDIYEGHSWADGYADFADGNNQESSSEAVNAWYGVYLWGKTLKNDLVQKYAAALYTTEIESALTYWFNKDGIYTDPYTHKIATIVWGGKVDFATWFSDKTNMKYGIELLPFTPASGYLGTLPEFSGYEEDYTSHKGDITADWGDLFVMWKSMYTADDALKAKNSVTKFEGNTTKSAFLYFLYAAQSK